MYILWGCMGFHPFRTCYSELLFKLQGILYFVWIWSNELLLRQFLRSGNASAVYCVQFGRSKYVTFLFKSLLKSILLFIIAACENPPDLSPDCDTPKVIGEAPFAYQSKAKYTCCPCPGNPPTHEAICYGHSVQWYFPESPWECGACRKYCISNLALQSIFNFMFSSLTSHELHGRSKHSTLCKIGWQRDWTVATICPRIVR